MRDELDVRVNKYFNNRTKKKNGPIIDLMSRPKVTDSTILVGDNDYLSIASHSDVIKVQTKHLTGASSEVVMSKVFVNEDIFAITEEKLAAMVGQESCFVTQSGYAANVGLMQSICDRNMHVFMDEKVHASLWEGVFLKRPKVHTFEHNNSNHLESLLVKFGPGLIVVESLYSVNGDLCPLEEVLDLKDKYHSIIVVDESHTLGVYGENGRGLCHQLTKQGREIDFVTSSLAKAFCTRAGLVAGSKKMVEYIKCRSSVNVFSSSIMANEMARINAFIDLIKQSDERRLKLHQIATELFNRLVALGYKLHSPHPSPIISIVLNDEDEMDDINKFLQRNEIHAAPFAHPATPVNEPVLRFTVSYAITEQQIVKIVQTLSTHKSRKVYKPVSNLIKAKL